MTVYRATYQGALVSWRIGDLNPPTAPTEVHPTPSVTYVNAQDFLDLYLRRNRIEECSSAPDISGNGKAICHRVSQLKLDLDNEEDPTLPFHESRTFFSSSHVWKAVHNRIPTFPLRPPSNTYLSDSFIQWVFRPPIPNSPIVQWSQKHTFCVSCIPLTLEKGYRGSANLSIRLVLLFYMCKNPTEGHFLIARACMNWNAPSATFNHLLLK